jgi:nucleotide-binding universal stress UspA family protein
MTTIPFAPTLTARPSPEGPLFANVLCGVDGTRSSYAAVSQAAALAGPGATLTLLVVTAAAGAMHGAVVGEKRTETILDHARLLASEQGVESATRVDDGPSAVDALIAATRTHDLLAIGAPTVLRFVPGSVALAALHTCSTPLLLARRMPAATAFMKQIVVASDGAEDSDRVVELACRLARRNEARLTLVHAHGSTDHSRSDRLESQMRTVEAEGHEIRTALERARRLIVDTAVDLDASLVVLGTRRPPTHRPFGSVSEYVLRHVRCSVLAVPPTPAAR